MSDDHKNTPTTKARPLMEFVRPTADVSHANMTVEDTEAAMVRQEAEAAGPLGTIGDEMLSYEESMAQIAMEDRARRAEQYAFAGMLSSNFVERQRGLRTPPQTLFIHTSDDAKDPGQDEFLEDMQKSAALVSVAMEKPTGDAHRMMTMEIAEMRHRMRKMSREIRVLTEEFLPALSPPLRLPVHSAVHSEPMERYHIIVEMSFGRLALKLPINPMKPKHAHQKEVIDILHRSYMKRVIEEHEKVFKQYAEQVAASTTVALMDVDTRTRF
jgi:hypothetical protein